MDQAEPVLSSSLACTNCRHRKIRCSRTTPICNQCNAHNLNCCYPRRKPRAPRRKKRTNPIIDRDTIAILLERLRRIEGRNSTDSQSSTPPTSQLSSITVGSPTIDRSDLTSTSEQNENCSTSPANIALNESPKLPHNDDDSVLVDMRHTLTDRTRSRPEQLDVTSILSEAVAHIQQLRGRHNANLHDITTEGISIPPELARIWIHNYFTYMPVNLFLTLVDRKLIEMIPDLIAMRHVRLDACIVLVYYVILYHGCFLPGKRSYDSPDRKYARQLYLCCLRTVPIWQKEATGTVTDFIAAIYMTRTAAECFDFDLSWEMHKLACEFAQNLQMHSLDGDGVNPSSPSTDDDRKGMWELIQMDLFYRLIYNKPGALSPSLDSWRVNLPWLSLDSPPDGDAAVPTMTFLVSSRLTFVLTQFFERVDKSENSSIAVESIEPLCQEVEDLLEEWAIKDWIESFKHDEVYTWILTDLALSGYTSILFMMRKATLGSDSPEPISSDSDIPQTELATKASRRILELIWHMLQVVNLPGPEALSSTLGTYRVHLAYAYLASSLIQSPPGSDRSADIELLKRVEQCVATIAYKENDFIPLVRALRSIIKEIKE